MKRYYELDPEDYEIVQPVLQNNSYFHHSESIILIGITGEVEYNRKCLINQ